MSYEEVTGVGSPSGTGEEPFDAKVTEGETGRSPWAEEARKRFGVPVVDASADFIPFKPFKLSADARLGLGGPDAFAE